MNNPLCFVIMPFGKKKDADGNEINFDIVYEKLIKPGIEAADMDPIRADEETVNGIIHKPMYERLILCDYAVADLTTANANVFYELGIRHAVKPYTTITLFSGNAKLPFDVNFLRSLPYEYDKDGQMNSIDKNISALTAQLLRTKKDKTTDSPIYQLVDGIAFQNSVAHEKTDIFRDKVKYDEGIKSRLAVARKLKGSNEEKIKAVDDIAASIKPENEEAGVLIDIMLSYRALKAYDKMIGFITSMPIHVQQTVMVQEQLGFAFNRINKSEEAIAVLEKVIKENGPSSETYGILGRVYKDLYDKAAADGNEILSDSYLDKAIDTYTKGFEADWRDAYPGINAVSLLEIKGDREKISGLAPVVEYAAVRKMATKTPEYWDYATLLELAVIENNAAKAIGYLRKALACPIEGAWMFETTLKTVNLAGKVRNERKEDTAVTEKLSTLLTQQIKALDGQ